MDKVDKLHVSYRLCGKHFEDRMFINDLKNRIRPDAHPTFFPILERHSGHDEHSYSSNVMELKISPGVHVS